jgi:hypothetical protein
MVKPYKHPTNKTAQLSSLMGAFLSIYGIFGGTGLNLTKAKY